MRTRAAVLGLALVVAVAGCGGGAKAKVAAPTTTVFATPPAAQVAAARTAVAKAVKVYSAELVAGKGKKAYPLLSTRCRTVITASAFNALASQAHLTYPHAKLKKVTVLDVKGTQAHVTYTYTQAVLNQQDQSWTKEHGAWRWDGC